MTVPLLIIAALCAVAWYYSQTGNQENKEEKLLAAIYSAANGVVISPHVYGGTLAANRDGSGRTMVFIDGLPAKVCVQVGWQLSKEGTVAVNGMVPPRISAGRLTDLCHDDDGKSSLTWTPQ